MFHDKVHWQILENELLKLKKQITKMHEKYELDPTMPKSSNLMRSHRTWKHIFLPLVLGYYITYLNLLKHNEGLASKSDVKRRLDRAVYLKANINKIQNKESYLEQARSIYMEFSNHLIKSIQKAHELRKGKAA